MVRPHVSVPRPVARATFAVDCRECGACCAFFRVSFYWAEALAVGLPDHLLEQVSPWHTCMAGTGLRAPCCLALAGEVGRRVRCTVYAQRPAPCRELQPGDAKCIQARHGHALPPIVASELRGSASVRDGLQEADGQRS